MSYTLSQSRSQSISFSARSFDQARPRVALPVGLDKQHAAFKWHSWRRHLFLGILLGSTVACN